VPLPKVRGIAEEEMFKVVKTGKKTAKKGIPISCFLRQNDC
jgi:ribosome biogenesis protein NSA2